jgi:hypothetical protein
MFANKSSFLPIILLTVIVWKRTEERRLSPVEGRRDIASSIAEIGAISFRILERYKALQEILSPR